MKQEIEIASSRNNLAGTPLEWSAESVDGLHVVEDVDGQACARTENPVELLNDISLGDKPKSKEVRALRDPLQKRIEGADQSRTSPAGKLPRVTKPRKPDHISRGSKGDLYTVLDFPVAEECAGPGAPSSMTSADQSMKQRPDRRKGKLQDLKKQHKQEDTVSNNSQSVPDQAKVTRTMSSCHTKTCSIGTNISNMVEEEDEDTVQPRLAISEGKPQPVPNARKQAQTNGGTKPEPASSTRILRSHATNDKSQRTESSKLYDRRSRTLSLSSNGEKGDDNSAAENVGDAHNDASESESYAHPDGSSDVDQDHDDHDGSDGNDQPCSDEFEQDHQENDVVDASRLEDLVGLEIELFGEDDSWATVLDGARRVGMSEVKGILVKEKPKLETKSIENIITLVKEVKGMYKNLSQYQENDHDGRDGLHQQLIEGLGKITREIEQVSETKAGNKKAEVIQDIYAHAIPHLVRLLEVALQCRTKEYAKSYDTDALQEVIALQDDILKICHKAREWKTKPLTSRPIIRPTSHKIFPYLRDVKRAFQTVFEERKRQVELKKQRKANSKRRREYDEENRRRDEENERLRVGIWREIEEQLDQNEATSAGHGRNNQLSKDNSILGTPHFRQSFTSNDWTQEQDLELLRRLQWKTLRCLPGLYLNHT